MNNQARKRTIGTGGQNIDQLDWLIEGSFGWFNSGVKAWREGVSWFWW